MDISQEYSYYRNNRLGKADEMKSLSARSLIFLFAIAYVLSFVDRQILSLLITPVKHDLFLTDFQFSILNGLAFASLYAILGLPISALSDRIRRPPIIAAGIAVWSLATLGCGLSHNFRQLFFCRMVVGTGEAALVPAVYSFLADIVPPRRLGRTLALFSLGSFVGAGLAYLCGGALLSAIHGAQSWHGIRSWKLCFIAVGLPGIPLATVIAIFVKEPGPRAPFAHFKPGPSATTFFRQYPAFFFTHFLGYSSTAVTLFSLMSWTPAFFMRAYHMPHALVGEMMGVIVIVCGCGGAYTSGRLIDALNTRHIDNAPVKAGLVGSLCAAATLILAMSVANEMLCVALMSVTFFFASFPMPPSAIVLQQIVPKMLRSQFSAVLLLCNSLIGLSGGSMLIGYLDDRVFTGTGGVAYALALVAGGASVLAALLIYLSGRLNPAIESAAARPGYGDAAAALGENP
ncbi:MFS transporter [Nguyenibacter sp. L1]|uniref:spinster family MFS transporter n=1 Tax=Nguyenibacter sp. L1 TaxID=3049350 RepID=UPI002B45CE33|nr:MFS transporter [Nguyenibacter sp. L1]WRH89292.1 MFS transporter [Nguyenibacter sp. L1]